MLGEWSPEDFGVDDGSIARMNALVALERRTEIEAEAPAMLKAKTYLEPFTLRALGYAREDPGSIRRAIETFEAMGLDWHAAETRSLMSRG